MNSSNGNMQFPNSDAQNGFYPRGGGGRGFRGRFTPAGGRGGRTTGYNPTVNEENLAQPAVDDANVESEGNPEEQEREREQTPMPDPTQANNEPVGDSTQLRGIPTIDSEAYNGPGFGRGQHIMRGSFHVGRGGFARSGNGNGNGNGNGSIGQGVVGAPAAPKAMREGLPNTSVFRQRPRIPSKPSESLPR